MYSVQEASSPLTLTPGMTLDGGKYRIVRLLGAGGMGGVYEAQNTLTHKRVAIKWMHPLQAAHSGPERLVREAQASARVRHRNAVDIYDVGREGDTVFLVMQYLEGHPLTEALQRGLPMHRVIALLLPAMRAVAAAHKQGVIHRDIKPDNIFLAIEDGEAELIPKVLDFGISKVDEHDGAHAPLTRTGGALGTPRYMSLEQLSGARDIDGRTDVYAFGVILYEALTGQPPFAASSFPELIYKVTTTTPREPKELRPDIPSALSAIVVWALARDRAARIPSIEALIAELEPFATEFGFRREMTTGESELPAALPVGEVSISEVRRTTALRVFANETPRPAPPSPNVVVGAPAPRTSRASRPLLLCATLAAAAVVGGSTVWLREPPPDPPAAPRVLPSFIPAPPSPAGSSQPEAPEPSRPAEAAQPMPAAASGSLDPAAPKEDAGASLPAPATGPMKRPGPGFGKRRQVVGPSDAGPQKAEVPARVEDVATDPSENMPHADPETPPSPAQKEARPSEGFRVPTLPSLDQF